MRVLKIHNIGSNGVIDYKGLNIEMFVPGSALYPYDLTVSDFCYVKTTEENIPNHPDILDVDQEEYDSFRLELIATRPKDPMEIMQEKIEELEQKLQVATETIDYLLGV